MKASAQDAVQKLREGNQRFASRSSPTGRAEGGPKPSAPGPPVALLACADPEVEPEVVFDLAPGSVFVVRTAGPVLDDATLGSLEYAVAERAVSLIVVLGHRGCRLVRAAVTRPTATGDLGIILDAIEPAVIRARHASGRVEAPATETIIAELTDAAAREHVRATAADLRTSRIIHPYIDEGAVSVVGALFDPATGIVEWLEQ